MKATPEEIASTEVYKKIKDPIKQRFLRDKTARKTIDHGVTISLNRGFEYWDANYEAHPNIKKVVKELSDRELKREKEEEGVCLR